MASPQKPLKKAWQLVEVVMRFPMIVYKGESSSYGGFLPDFPGCYPMGETLDALLADVQGAVETWMEGEDPAIFPVPAPLEIVQTSPDAKNRVLLLVDVDTALVFSRPGYRSAGKLIALSFPP